MEKIMKLRVEGTLVGVALAATACGGGSSVKSAAPKPTRVVYTPEEFGIDIAHSDVIVSAAARWRAIGSDPVMIAHDTSIKSMNQVWSGTP